MVEGVLFFSVVMFVVYIVFWSVQNDSAKTLSEQRGLLRMRDLSTKKRRNI